MSQQYSCTNTVQQEYMLHPPLGGTTLHISQYSLPCTVKLLLAVEGLLLDTVHWYCPGSLPVTVSVWVYLADSVSSNRVIPPVTSSEYLVQVTVVAGPPVEIQVRVN